MTTACTPTEFTRWPTRSARSATCIVVAPHIEASAIGHALTLRRPLRIEQLRDGVYEVDGTPTDCVNIAITKLYRRAARSRRLRHQQGLQPRRRRDVLGHGVGRARRRRCSACRAIAVSQERTRAAYDFIARGRRRGDDRRAACCARGCAPQTFLSLNVPTGKPKGFKLTVQAKRNHVTIVDERMRPARQGLLLDRRRGERLGAARSLRLPGGARRLRLRHAAAAGHDRLRRAGEARDAGAGEHAVRFARLTARPSPAAVRP